MKTLRHVLFAILVISLCSCIPLLAGGTAGGFSVAYVAGELQTHEPVTIDEGYMSAQRALEGLELKVTDREKDALTAKVVAYGAEDKKITVRLERQSDNLTIVKIRVGLLGDQDYSLTVLDRMEQELGLSNGAPRANLPQESAPRY
jgi:hypothetical protein